MSNAKWLDQIRSPQKLREKVSREELQQVVDEIRAEILLQVSATGGHLAASLGSLELITAIHYVFDTPRDRLVLDVGHQGYAHKMLTGRREHFAKMGELGGMSKFLNRQESEYDHFGSGHAGNSISACVGIARALQHQGRDGCAIALIGDGAMTAGMAFEALNHAGDLKQKNLVVVLNDNEMSISPNVGALNSYLSRKFSAPTVRRAKGWAKDFLRNFPGDLTHWAHKIEESVKVLFTPGMLFEAFNFRYVGPVEGNQIGVLLETFDNVKQMLANGEGPILVHAVTQKGYGYEPAQRDPLKYHGVTKFDVASGEFAASKSGPPSYTKVFSDALIRLAEKDERIVAITAAMGPGTGLDRFQERFPDRYYDVGIAEQHAVTFAAGLASEGMKPVAAIYSTFLQRAYDQMIHDVCLQNLDVTFAIDRAGLVGNDGATHQGQYDLSYLRSLPNMIVMAPKDENELQHMLATAIAYPGPAAVRYPRGAGFGVPFDQTIKALPVGEAELLRDGDDAVIVAIGSLVHSALEAAAALAADGLSVAVLNARFAKPLDRERILALARRTGRIVTVEENTRRGGFGSAVLEALAEAQVAAQARILALPDRVIEHGDSAKMLSSFDLDVEGIAQAVREIAGAQRAPSTKNTKK